MRRLVGGMAICIVAIVAFSWAAADDKEIAREITERLKQKQDDGTLHDFDINLKVAEGNVLIQGEVCSPEQQTLALDIARTASGVKQVVNDLKVKDGEPAPQPVEMESAVQLDDQQLAAAIASKLRRHQEAGLLKGFRIDIDVQEGQAALDGRVANADQLDLVLKTVRGTQGISDVLNRLTIAESTKSTEEAEVSDQEIASQIAASLRRCKDMGTLTGFNIDLSVENGVVMLVGRVSNKEQQQLALDIAENVKGVQDVVNHLAIEEAIAEEENPIQPASFSTPEPVADPQGDVPDDFRIGEELTRQLRDAKQQGILQSFGIGIHVEQGTVWLKGRVSSSDQQKLALELARRVDGVRKVVNELTVEGVQTPQTEIRSSEEIAQEIRERMNAEKQLGRFAGAAFDVKVEGRDIWLGGTVASAEQEQRAVEVASKVSGVNKVMDALSVANPALGTPMQRATTPQLVQPAAGTTRLASLQMPRSEASSEPSATAQAELPITPAAIDAGPAAASSSSVQPLVSGPARMSVGTSPEASFQQDSSQAMQSIRHAALPETSLSTAPIPAARVAEAQSQAQVVRVQSAQPVVYPQMMSTYPAMSAASNNRPLPIGAGQRMAYAGAAVLGAPIMAVNHMVGGSPASMPGPGQAVVPARYDHPNLPGYAWPSYAAHPNYAAVTYPKQYSPTAWPYIGPFYPYPQVPLGWRKVTLKWDDGWWQLNFNSK